MAAARAGADAVAVHFNLGAPTENAMLERLGRSVEAADRLGLPVVAISYPRGLNPTSLRDDNHEALRDEDPEAFAKLVRHAVRVAVEIGVSAVKTVYTEDEETFASVVDAALGAPIIMAGGPVTSDDDARRRAAGAIRAGAAGVAFGRQVFLNNEPRAFLGDLRTTVDTAAGGAV